MGLTMRLSLQAKLRASIQGIRAVPVTAHSQAAAIVAITEAASERISPNMLAVHTTSNCDGSWKNRSALRSVLAVLGP